MHIEALLNNCLKDILNMTSETQRIRTQKITNLFLKLPLPLLTLGLLYYCKTTTGYNWWCNQYSRSVCRVIINTLEVREHKINTP